MYVCYRADVRRGCTIDIFKMYMGCTECGCLCVTEQTFDVVALSVDVCVLQSRRWRWLY